MPHFLILEVKQMSIDECVHNLIILKGKLTEDFKEFYNGNFDNAYWFHCCNCHTDGIIELNEMYKQIDKNKYERVIK